MKKIKLYLITAIIAFTLITSCKIKKPVFTRFNNLKVYSLNSDKVDFSIDAVYYNPSFFRAKIKKVDFEAYLNSTALYQYRKETDIDINSMNYFSVPIRVEFNPMKTGPKTLALITNIIVDKKVDLMFDGKVYGKTFGHKFKIPIHYQETFNPSILMNYKDTLN